MSVFSRWLVEMLVNAEARGTNPSHRCCTARRADRIEDIELMEIDTLGGQPVDVGSFQPRVVVAGPIPPTPVVGIDQNDVRVLPGITRRVDRLAKRGNEKKLRAMIRAEVFFIRVGC